MDAAWSILKADPRMQAFSLTEPINVIHPDSTRFPQRPRVTNLGTIDPNVMSMALRQMGRGTSVNMRDLMTDESQVPEYRQGSPMSLHSQIDYSTDGSDGFNSLAGRYVPAPEAISRANRNPPNMSSAYAGQFLSRPASTHLTTPPRGNPDNIQMLPGNIMQQV